MANVWKIGTRWSDWGDSSASVLSIMRRNNVAFVWLNEADQDKFLSSVKKGDYIALADGYQIVAIGKATGNADYLRNFKNFYVSSNDYEYFSLDEGRNKIVAVKINIVDIEDGDKAGFWYQKQIRFCSLNQLRDEVKEYYDSHLNRFSIQTYTGTIGEDNKNSHCLLNKHVSYVIPVYQRPYEWGEEQVSCLINDILYGYLGKDRNCRNPEPVFIGTMQLSKRKPISNIEYEHDVVDGQQRITTLTIFLNELKKMFPECQSLKDLDFKWLKTHVSEQQNVYLYNYLHTDITELNNRYCSNAKIVLNTIELFLQNQEEDFDFDIDDFCHYLFNYVIFVVIETSAGLSKTIQIFNTINNTGLDLNGSDLFKIRMYEYLRDVKMEDETVFEQIQNVYNLVDVNNKKYGKSYGMGTMLDLYKNILITRYDLNILLYSFGWETFFDRLFDALLGVNEKDNFKNLNGLELSLDVLTEIIELRYDKGKYQYKYLETEFATRMISCFSRYGRSENLIVYPFLFFCKNEPNIFEQFERLIVALNKYFFIHSIENSRQINKVNNFVAHLVKSVRDNSSEEIIQKVKEQINLEDEEWLKWAIGRDLCDGSRWWKYLICGVSTFLKERGLNSNDLVDKIFSTDSFDIEHIHASADGSIEIPSDLQNSIGNLTQLEYDINRSIQDKPFSEKRKRYSESSYLFIKEIAMHDEWTIDDIKKRKEQETFAIYNYIKTEKELSYNGI
jgi:uncharacterized protein with ParB-like and HNH nuclease domain